MKLVVNSRFRAFYPDPDNENSSFDEYVAGGCSPGDNLIFVKESEFRHSKIPEVAIIEMIQVFNHPFYKPNADYTEVVESQHKPVTVYVEIDSLNKCVGLSEDDEVARLKMLCS